MTEIHRYKAVTMISAAGATIGYDPHGPDVVMAAEFDRVTAERDALQQRLNAADQRIDELDPGHSLSAEAASTLRWMVEYCLNHRVCMGMDEGFKSFDPEEEHDFVKELRGFAERDPNPALTPHQN